MFLTFNMFILLILKRSKVVIKKKKCLCLFDSSILTLVSCTFIFFLFETQVSTISLSVIYQQQNTYAFSFPYCLFVVYITSKTRKHFLYLLLVILSYENNSYTMFPCVLYKDVTISLYVSYIFLAYSVAV